jgi:ribulose-5-phosphate 4-epimerase/fuculose-1-phosphate aldolase
MWRASELETLAKMYYLALVAGRPVILADDEILHTVERFKNYGARPESELKALAAPKKARAKKAGAKKAGAKKVGPKKKAGAKSAAARRRPKKTAGDPAAGA